MWEAVMIRKGCSGVILVSRFFLAFASSLTIMLSGAALGQNPIPHINQPLTPDAVRPGSAGFSLTVKGSGFVGGAIVRWNGHPRTTTFIGRSRLTVDIPSSDIARPGTAAVSVFNPSPGGGESNVAFLEVTPRSSSIALNISSFSPVGGTPTSVAVADFNRDGRLDLAAANEGSHSVSVLLGNGDGTFNAATHSNVKSASESVAVGDFNGDGKLDLVGTDLDSASVSVLLGNGDGTFKAAVHYGVGLVPYSVAVGDFNADGILDLGVTNNGSSGVSMLLGNGDGTFKSAVDYGVGLSPTGLAVADLNGDGKLDVAVTTGNGINILMGNGDGTFQEAVVYTVGSGGISVAVADLNGDGKPDLAVASVLSNDVSVLMGNGDGTFRAAVNYATGSEALSVTLGDFNGDGKLDLAVAAGYPDYGVNVLLNNGDGTFKSSVTYSVGLISRGVATGDFNGDGRLDIGVGVYGKGAVTVLRQIPTISLSKKELAFTNRLIGTTSAAQKVALTNTGGLPASISSVAIMETNASDFSQTTTCKSTLAPGATCYITVTFRPTRIGPRTASVIITDDAEGTPQAIALIGTGLTSGPNATVAPSVLKFVPQLLGTASPAKTVELANYGTVPLSIKGIAASGDFAETNSCGSSVPAGARCTINVLFKPTQINTRTGTLLITDNAPVTSQAVRLNGAGTIVEFVPLAVDFGSLQQCKQETQTVILTNTGSTALNISDISVTGSSNFTETNDCGVMVNAKQSCTLTVRFAAGGYGIKAGTRSGEVTISDSGGGGSQTVPLSGTVVLCRDCCF